MEGIHIPKTPYSLSEDDVCTRLYSSLQGLDQSSILQRQETFGRNSLPLEKPINLLQIYLHQFLNPLIYILLVAAAVSLMIGELSDAIFIVAVLIINAT